MCWLVRLGSLLSQVSGLVRFQAWHHRKCILSRVRGISELKNEQALNNRFKNDSTRFGDFGAEVFFFWVLSFFFDIGHVVSRCKRWRPRPWRHQTTLVCCASVSSLRFYEDSLSLGSVQHSRGPFGQWNLPAIRDGGGWWRSQCRFGFELWWTLMPRFESFLIFLSQAWHHQEIKEYFPFWFFFPWDPASEAAKSCCERWRAKFHHTLEPPDSGRRGLFRSV